MPAAAPVFDPARRFTDPEDVLRTVFGFDDFRPGQRKIIDAVIAGRDCIGLMPTGAGKSLTFQIPAKILGGPVLVLSPLISLMKDQVDALRQAGVRAAALNSGLPPGEAAVAQALVEAGKAAGRIAKNVMSEQRTAPVRRGTFGLRPFEFRIA